MKKVSLILSQKEDEHVHYVLNHLKLYPDCEIIFLDTDNAITDFKLNINFNNNDWEGTLNGYKLSQLNSIWYRRPTRPKAKKGNVNEKFVPLVEDEMRELLHNFYRISNCKILPHPKYNNEADFKLLQLKVAKNLGFKIPFTLISNTVNWEKLLPNSIKNYCVKSIGAYHWIDKNDTEYSLRSSKVSVDLLKKHSNDFRLCPTLIQEYIEKKYEWRITVVDKEIFACRLDSQVIEEAKEDWRIADVGKIPHEICEINDSLKNNILRYLEYFNLPFGAFDFIEDKNGEFYFLECNPNGQWLWIEIMTKAKISNSIAKYLFT